MIFPVSTCTAFAPARHRIWIMFVNATGWNARRTVWTQKSPEQMLRACRVESTAVSSGSDLALNDGELAGIRRVPARSAPEFTSAKHCFADASINTDNDRALNDGELAGIRRVPARSAPEFTSAKHCFADASINTDNDRAYMALPLSRRCSRPVPETESSG
jgi:hypothetical protein